MHIPSQRLDLLQPSAAYYRKLIVSHRVSILPPASVIVIHQTRRKYDSLLGILRARLAKHSHPVAATDGTVGLGGLANDLLPSSSAQSRLSILAGSSLGCILGLASCGLVRGLPGGLLDRLGILLVLVNGPIEDIIVLKSFTNKEVAENLAKITVIRLVVETQRASVVQVDGKLVGETTAKDLGGSSHLLLHDAIILLLLSGRLQPLPGQRTTAEVEHDITKRLHIITTRLLNSKMGVDRGIASRSSQVLVLSVGNVEVSLGIPVFLGETEIDDVDLVTTLANAHQEVVRLDIAVNERFGVDVFDPRNQLVGQEQNGLERELAVAEVEQVFQAGAEKIQNHGVVVALRSEPANKGDTDTASKRLVDTGLVFKLGMLCLDTLKLDGDLLTGNDVGAEVDITE